MSIGVSKLYLQRNKKENAPQQLPSLFWIVVVSNITGATSRHYGHSTDSSLMDDVCELEWDQTFDGWSYHRHQIGRGQTKMVVPETYLKSGIVIKAMDHSVTIISNHLVQTLLILKAVSSHT